MRKFSRPAKFESKLARRIAISIIAISSVITIVTTAIQLYGDYTRDLEGIEDSFHTIRKSHLPSLIKDVWIAEASQIQTHLEGLASLPDIEYAAINVDGEVRWRAGEIQSKRRIGRTYPMLYNYRDAYIEIGTLVVEISIDKIFDRLWRKFVIVLFTNAVKTFIVAGFIFFIFYRLVSRHLSRIAAFARAANPLEKLEQLQLDRDQKDGDEADELDEVVEAINTGQSAVRTTIRTLRESEERYKILFESAAISIWNEDFSEVVKTLNLLRQNGVSDLRRYLGENQQAAWDIAAMVKVNDVNQATLRLFKAKSKNELTESIDKTFGPDAIDVFVDELCAIWEEEKNFQSDATHRTLGGDELTVIISMPIPETEEGFANVPVSILDITERQALENRLHQAQRQLQSFVDHVPALVSIKDLEGNYLLMNNHYDKKFGLNLTNVKYTHAANPFPEKLVKLFAAQEQLVIKSMSDVTREYAMPFGNGNHFHLCTKFPLLGSSGTIEAVGTISTDITERKRVEEELASLNENLEKRVEKRTADLLAVQDELLRQERMATLGQLTATISHELRNPLGVIQASNFVLRDNLKDCDPRVRRSLDRIDRSTVRCDRIIDEILDFTRIRQLKTEPTLIDTWLDRVLEEQTLHTDITLRREYGLPGVKVFLDPDRFRRAVINIFDNACQAMVGDSNGKIEEGEHILTIQTGKTNGRIEVVFEDNGPGIPQDVLPEIFEPMFSTKGFGVGLGLTVVKQIMEQHGGGIEIGSRQGRGTRACLWLPSEHAVH